jgi:putative flippase GtrA
MIILNPQILFFLLIGSLAAATNFILVWCFVDYNLLNPLTANAIAFLIAFNVSYLGHRKLTFKQSSRPIKKTLPYFFSNAVIGLLLSECIYYLFLHYTSFHYLLALLSTMSIVAIYTFIISKWVIFKS